MQTDFKFDPMQPRTPFVPRLIVLSPKATFIDKKMHIDIGKSFQLFSALPTRLGVLKCSKPTFSRVNFRFPAWILLGLLSFMVFSYIGTINMHNYAFRMVHPNHNAHDVESKDRAAAGIRCQQTADHADGSGLA